MGEYKRKNGFSNKPTQCILSKPKNITPEDVQIIGRINSRKFKTITIQNSNKVKSRDGGNNDSKKWYQEKVTKNYYIPD